MREARAALAMNVDPEETGRRGIADPTQVCRLLITDLNSMSHFEILALMESSRVGTVNHCFNEFDFEDAPEGNAD